MSDLPDAVHVEKPVLQVLAGRQPDRPPFWLMRQAGRYLPEYRTVRAQAGSFLDLCFNPELACEVTIQPLRRYRMDAAILFSDILIVPYALGQDVRFAEGEGPQLPPIRDREGLRALSQDQLHQRAAPVYATVRAIRAELARDFPQTTLIGFAGAPWTVACYMVEGGGSKEFQAVKRWAFSDPDGFGQLMDLLIEATVAYLSAQVEAGAEVVQLFDSWAGVLPAAEFDRWVIEPARRIAAALLARYPGLPLIGFPRGAGSNLTAYVSQAGMSAVSLDSSVSPAWAALHLPPTMAVQGNLDPVALLCGGRALQDGTAAILNALSGRPFIFNLGHGIIKETPPEHVAALARQIRGD
jgi:uroporphyrinogen decarboxylase